jgi:hypothetical protein
MKPSFAYEVEPSPMERAALYEKSDAHMGKVHGGFLWNVGRTYEQSA